MSQPNFVRFGGDTIRHREQARALLTSLERAREVTSRHLGRLGPLPGGQTDLPIDSAIARTRSIIRAFDELIDAAAQSDTELVADATRSHRATQRRSGLARLASPATSQAAGPTEPAHDEHREHPTNSPRAAA